MKFKIDLHVHSKYSGDTDSDPEETILRAIELGLHGIAFTEHYSYEASGPIEVLKKKYGGRILVLRGVEFSTAEGHCLIFGTNADKLSIKYASVKDTLRIVNKAGGVVIPSHRSVGGICALEGYNGCNMHAFNVKAIEAAELMKIPFTGGSDAHAPHEVGSCFTEFDDNVTYENFIDLLKRGKYRGVDARKISRMMVP
jgi:predicted metal-dependent phosphoesterase TrpH